MYQVGEVAVVAELVDAHHVGVLETREIAGLAPEHLDAIGVVGVLGEQPLDDDEALEGSPGDRQEDLGHPADGEPRHFLVLANHGPESTALRAFGRMRWVAAARPDPCAFVERICYVVVRSVSSNP